MSRSPIRTPPGTTLSTPSPTELHDTDPLAETMPTTQLSSHLKHIYLVVATTPITTASGKRLGIGLEGRLPWPLIKEDMAYFRKVTTNGQDVSKSENRDSQAPNRVFMGRKTYESIPIGFRPLSQRQNYVVTRSDLTETAERYKDDIVKQSRRAQEAVRERYDDANRPSLADLSPNSVEYREMLLSEAQLTTRAETDLVRVFASNKAILPLSITSNMTKAIDDSTDEESGGIFCIGGAEIYKMILDDRALRPRLRILQTEILKLKEGEEYECDTFWPEDLSASQNGWREADRTEVVSWTGIELPQREEEWHVNKVVGAKIRVRGWQQDHVE